MDINEYITLPIINSNSLSYIARSINKKSVYQNINIYITPPFIHQRSLSQGLDGAGYNCTKSDILTGVPISFLGGLQITLK